MVIYLRCLLYMFVAPSLSQLTLKVICWFFSFRMQTVELHHPPFIRQVFSEKFASFLVFFPCRKSAHRSWVTPLCIVWATTLNSISSGIYHQNTQFNMYTTTSKQQEGCTFEDSHPKCFITTNSTTKLSRGAVNRGDVHVLRASYTKVNSNTVCNYFHFIWHNGLSLLYGDCSISLISIPISISISISLFLHHTFTINFLYLYFFFIFLFFSFLEARMDTYSLDRVDVSSARAC